MPAVFRKAFGYNGDAMNLPVASVEVALPFYEKVMGFCVDERRDTPHKAAVLSRDDVRMTLAENGGDPQQDGYFFLVDDVEAAFAELQANGIGRDDPQYEINEDDDGIRHKQFFVIAPDGLCFCIAERLNPGT
jgi:lactoylglutathione lyase